MSYVTKINPSEPVAVNNDRLGALYAQMGEVSAEDILCRAMEELALRMSHCERLFRTDDHAGLRKSARSLIAIAEQIGMDVLARVAGDVTYCIDRKDTVALAATVNRLMRTGEGSLTAVWDLQDITL
ncbi:hypothetical protein JQX09_00920 [Sulfitobacter pseudonitzschiae]|uniref:Uncharacterized protein n=1 Tax=Pseudosulfitobacter pseudonitzschiae TaxID=1402135 RepID=A0A9Q2NIH0_9RHOB|nr:MULTISPECIES: hypothetical protein [Roseobacteraceae]MBM2290455.1 hypothetical protein [Pseudosulfitobacter pseudonitzschiae]MBM2295373.1 hypothetical protein [Pseudosulfitobacter pseudonitzschiae]MBM2300285.1 hypothetical protein [Pseudosulfitobacter pseudonitzschiae]MBM2310070.1 hypothetical protein [Pseudosulfitobacter pseudonitzschiae]MBM2314982.1 hypothetical protein [Pseudosulfitobacter pseudonitzschiae]|tara:strand:- start:19803 stop:20183 length:381 start_codon:yes stop_codon:yes gene_type:complete